MDEASAVPRLAESALWRAGAANYGTVAELAVIESIGDFRTDEESLRVQADRCSPFRRLYVAEVPYKSIS
jgi:hypothetical protein